MIKRLNCFVNKVVPKAIGNEAAINPEMMRHYRQALPTPAAREACAALPGHIIGASDWMAEIWSGREVFADKPALVLSGLKDIAFRRKELGQWWVSLSDCEVHEFADCGHFLAEEAPDRIAPTLRKFVKQR
jgi:haloalkane dehalogenase